MPRSAGRPAQRPLRAVPSSRRRPRARPTRPSDERPAGRVPLAAFAIVAGVALAVYANSLGGALLYDDVNAIRNNALVRTGDVVGILGTPSWWGKGRTSSGVR